MIRRLAAAAALLGAPVVAHAATYVVNADGSGDYATIKDAIKNAKDGDRIEVTAGTYYESFTLKGKAIEVVGVDGSASTFIDSMSLSPYVVSFKDGESEATVLQGFTIHNDGYQGIGVQDSSPTLKDIVFEDLGNSSVNGGGLYIYYGSPTLEDCVFTGNVAANGAHLYLNSGTVNMSGATFEDGEAATYGGGIYVWLGDLNLTDSTVADNYAYNEGGGVFLASSANLTLDNVTLDDNHTEIGHGAGIYGNAYNTVTIQDSTISNNAAEEYTSGYQGGGIYFIAGTLAVSDSTFEGNFAYYGAAISTSTGAISLSGVTFDSNYGYYGGAIYAVSGSTVSDEGGVYDTNTSYYYGGAIYAYSQTSLSLVDTVFVENVAFYGYGGAVYHYYYGTMSVDGATFDENRSYYSGGAIYAYYVTEGVAIDSAIFTDNEATYGYGGAVYAYYYTDLAMDSAVVDGNEAYYAGGGVYQSLYGDLYLNKVEITRNIAENQSGGGVYFNGYTADVVDLSVTNSEVSHNLARYEGGGVYALYAKRFRLKNTVLESNSLEDDSFGGGVFARGFGLLEAQGNRLLGNAAVIGGGAYLAEAGAAATADFRNNVFQENTASRIGGGLALVSVPQVTVMNSVLLGNRSLEDGGALYAYASPLSLRNSIIGWTVDGLAVSVEGEDAEDPSVLAYNAWYDNAAGDVGGEVDTSGLEALGNLFEDPGLPGYSLNGEHDDDYYALAMTSPCIDAGDPEVLDLDGSRSDIGLFGGPDATLEDEDEDGFSTAWDCDDSDATVYPGAEDTWYDGINQDCSMGSDFDQDGDGAEADTYGGDDCDDTDPSITEGCAQEDTGPIDTGALPDDTDPPIDDVQDTGKAGPAGCGCATGHPAGAGAAALLLAGLALSRRRRQNFTVR